MGTDALPARGLTPNELARVLRVSPDRIRQWIASGELKAVNTAAVVCGKPRYVVLPHHLEEFTRRRASAPPLKPARRQRVGGIDFYTD
jgi:hypothetical protein